MCPFILLHISKYKAKYLKHQGNKLQNPDLNQEVGNMSMGDLVLTKYGNTPARRLYFMHLHHKQHDYAR